MARQDNGLVEYNHGLILNELERRFYLYLIGGDYEKLFYTFDSSDQDEFGYMMRVRLDVEIENLQQALDKKRGQHDPEYVKMLDYLATNRIIGALENETDLFKYNSPLSDILPLLCDFSGQGRLTDSYINELRNYPWLWQRIEDFLKRTDSQQFFKLNPADSPEQQLQTLGYPMYCWLIPRFCADQLQTQLHPSLRPTMGRLRSYGRLVAGAICSLMLSHGVIPEQRWQFYCLAAIDNIALTTLLGAMNSHLNDVMRIQNKSLADSTQDQKRRKILDNYSLPGQMLRQVFCMEEVVKPYMLDMINFNHFDPSPFILGYTDGQHPIAGLFKQAKAYAFYRQLYKTGRIHTHETVILLKQNRIGKATLAMLNKQELASFATHLQLHEQLTAQG